MEALNALRAQYEDDPIVIINEEPIDYVLNLDALSFYYDDDLLQLAAAIIRTIIQGHPLQDGNKRFGMVLGFYFLATNGLSLNVSNEDFLNTALDVAKGKLNREGLYCWLVDNAIK